MRIAAALVILHLCGAAFAAGLPDCPASPKLTGTCFTVHGRLSITNGSLNYRIWPVGTHRMLAVVDGAGVFDEENGPPLPANLRRAMNGFGTDIFGDYRVCPLTRSVPGHMQHVCVARASRLVVETADKPPRRIPDGRDR